MQEEHQLLSDKVFPELQRVCAERGTFFNPVDIQWSKGDTLVQKGHLLTAAFRYIERCAPFFIGLLGERYGYYCRSDPTMMMQSNSGDDGGIGLESDDTAAAAAGVGGADWLARNLLTAAACGHDWLLDENTRCKSVTELQVLYAAFKSCPRRHLLYDDAESQCHFYYRQPEYKDAYMTHLPPAARAQKLRQLEPEDDYCNEQCRRLKGDVIKRGHSVRYYTTLTELADYVLRDWRAVIDEFCPPIYQALNISNKKGMSGFCVYLGEVAAAIFV